PDHPPCGRHIRRAGGERYTLRRMTTSTPTRPAPGGATPRPPAQPAKSTLKVLVAEKFEQTGIDGLTNAGCEVACKPEVTAGTLAATVSETNPDILIVRGMKVHAPVFEAAKSLSLVLRAGAGYDNIDVAAASAKGVFVANCPGKNAIAVAELAWGLILS